MEELRAEFGKSCAGCTAAIAEPWPGGKLGYRCGAAGPCKGFVVGIGRYRPYIPAWCPRKNKEKQEEIV